jgi:hypothetical protein
MKLKHLFLALVMLLPMAAKADEAAPVETTITAQEQAVFFEPTQANYDASGPAITEQETRYKEAKKAGNYLEAVKQSLFYWTRAWLHFNKAISTISTEAAWNDPETLKLALTLLDKAEADAKLGKGAEAARILGLVVNNRAAIEKQMAWLKKPHRKKTSDE